MHISKKSCIFAARKDNAMGNLITHKISEPQTKRTAKGNVLYEFKRLTQAELDTYRIDSYGYIM